MESRTSNTIRNLKYAIFGQAAALLISFILRMVFLKILGEEYLGLDGLFANILSILSFAELGVGSAIVYSMYKPLEEKNIPKIKALMALYKKAYTIIGIVIAITGTAVTPFLNYVIKDMPNIPHIQEIYLMFVVNSALSYFFSYKRSLIIADQKRYIATLYRYSFYFILNLAQVLILLSTHNYILFLGLQIISTLAENMAVSVMADKLYPFLKEKSVEKLEAEEKRNISKNVKAMMFHKAGEIIVSGTDNLVISKTIGVAMVGLYSNYLLILNALNRIFDLIFQGILSSVGNLGVTESKEKQQTIFKCINLMGFWIYGFASIGLWNLVNPLIALWLGERYLLSEKVVAVLVVNFYINGMRRSVLTFREALGLFWYDRYKPVFETLINLVLSIILAEQIGIMGVFLGTVISIVTTCFWVEPLVLHKYGFHRSVKPYFINYIFYTGILLFAGGISWWICNFIKGAGMISFIEKLLITGIVPNLLFAAILWRSKEFLYLRKKLRLLFSLTAKK